MAIFARVVKAKSFTAAAEQSGVSPSAISKHITQLEERLNARLLNRSTRQLSLTEAGLVFYEYCARILAEAEAAELAVSRLQAGPRGTVRLVAPVAFGLLHIAPAVAALLERYPELRLDAVLDNKAGDIIGAGFDIAIRAHESPDSTLQARRLAPFRRVVCASPAYLARCGVPQTPQELASHQLFSSGDEEHEQWHFQGAQGDDHTVAVAGRLRASNGLVLRAALLADAGIARLPNYIVEPDLKAGRLQALLTGYRTPGAAIYALYPQNPHLSPKVRAVIDFLVERFSPRPYWETP